MLKIGITGGIGSGKSLVSKVFESLEIPVFYADEIGKIMLEQDTDLQTRVKDLFGKEIIGPEGLSRKKLAAIVFNNLHKLHQLNELIHPRVLDAFHSWTRQYSDRPYILLEAAILFETGTYRSLDATISVTAPKELRIKRVVSRDKMGESEVKARMRNQMAPEEINRKADFLLVNDEKRLLLPQIIELHNLLLQKNKLEFRNN